MINRSDKNRFFNSSDASSKILTDAISNINFEELARSRKINDSKNLMQIEIKQTTQENKNWKLIHDKKNNCEDRQDYMLSEPNSNDQSSCKLM